MASGNGPAGTLEGGEVLVHRSCVCALKAERDVRLERSMALAVVAQGNVEITNGGTGPLVAGGDVSITNGGCGPLVAGGKVSFRNGGCGFVFAPEVSIEEGGRVLMTTPQALAFGAALGTALGLLRLFVRRR